MDKRHVGSSVTIGHSATKREGRAPPPTARWWPRMLALGSGSLSVMLLGASCQVGSEPLALEVSSPRAELARGFGVDVPLSRQGGDGEAEVSLEGVPEGVEVDLGAGTLGSAATASVRFEAGPDAPVGVHELTIELRTEAETAEAAFTLVVSEGYGAERFSPLEGEVRELSVNGDTLVYEVIEGTAVFQGDIVLGSAAELEAAAQHLSAQGHIIAQDPCNDVFSAFSCETRWQGGVIPYEIAEQWGGEQAKMERRIIAAVQEWNDNTAVRLKPRRGRATSSGSCRPKGVPRAWDGRGDARKYA